MDVNTIALALFGFGALYVGWKTYSYYSPIQHSKQMLTPWNHQEGKTHHIQSKTGDASMFTQKVRRRTIAEVQRAPGKAPLRETRTSVGYTNGVVETYFIDPCCFPSKPKQLLLDGRFANDDECAILDDTGEECIV
jgi:hypothetical protein